MKQIALSIEQMKSLQSLRVDISKASMSWMVYKDITDEWIKEERPSISHFKHDEESSPIICLELGYSEGALYSDMSECSTYSCCEIIPAFTLQDILELLPKEMKSYDLVLFMDNHIQYEKWDGINHAKILVQFDGVTLLDSAYQMLCWCAEKGYLTTNNK